MTMLALSACATRSRSDLPNVGPFAPDHALPQGIAAGEVSANSALIWTRTKGPGRVQIEWRSAVESEVTEHSRSTVVHTSEEQDYTARVDLQGLAPATQYEYRILAGGIGPSDVMEVRATGRFRTAPPAERSESVRLVWSGDLGGQEWCRREPAGYAIFEQMRRVEPAFAILLGDLVYADQRCPSPPNVPGSDFVAATLNEFRAKHRYQREDDSLQRFLAEVPVYPTWDDHEVRNNFSGRTEPLMPLGRQALLEYWPIGPPATDPYRLYRQVRRGSDLEIFLLDARQYRSPNQDQDGEGKTMLGAAQRDWLIEGLLQTTATWKVIATSVPLTISKPGSQLVPGNDSWAGGTDGTGFQNELRMIVNAIKSRHVRNVVWLAADVHFVQINEYDPDGDQQVDFHEFVAGPLSARHDNPRSPEVSLHPRTRYSDGGFNNFGIVEVVGKTMSLRIVDQSGATRFAHMITAQ